ncbi:hypothetical protein LCGC14_2482300 [marine sediment metagenome]|uniref:RNA polymerase sigma-70 domain-containing protein n=1 Tax=marine sediment metagenome TaxID=412755 RepID=A0A0F9B776_9ZZZZ
MKASSTPDLFDPQPASRHGEETSAEAREDVEDLTGSEVVAIVGRDPWVVRPRLTELKIAGDLILGHLNLVHRLAIESTRTTGFSFYDDLVGAGMLGLVEAARRFDSARGVRFITFAYPRIRGAMADEIRRENGRYFHPTFVSLPDSLLGKRDDLDSAIDVDFLLAKMTKRNRRILEMRFIEDLTLGVIGKRVGLSVARICQIVAEARCAMAS